jgi:hypothetical protein
MINAPKRCCDLAWRDGFAPAVPRAAGRALYGRINAWVDRTSRFGWLNSRNRLPKALPSGLVANEKLEFTSPTHESHPR